MGKGGAGLLVIVEGGGDAFKSYELGFYNTLESCGRVERVPV